LPIGYGVGFGLRFTLGPGFELGFGFTNN